MSNTIEYPYQTGRGWIDTTKSGVNYTFLKDCYYGSGGFQDGRYLIPYPIENSYKFNIRKAKREITNHFQGIINAQVDPIFREPVGRIFEKDDPRVELFVSDVDHKDTDLDFFMKKVGLQVKILGSAFVVVDNITEPPKTKLEEINERKIPYLCLLEPSQIVKWEINENGRLVYFSYSSNTASSGGLKSQGVNNNVTFTWTESEIKIEGSSDESKNGTFTNELGYIPVVRVTDTETEDFIPFP